MLETCLENRIIYDFLTLYDQSIWHKLIPSLLEIAILNLHSSFNTFYFSEEDFENIIKDLKINQNLSLIYSTPSSLKTKNKNHIIFSKPPTEWRTIDGWGEPDNFIENKFSLSLKNSRKKKGKSVKSKIKDLVDLDKRNYYCNSENNLINRKINYAISYDKNLKPEIIEKKTIKNNTIKISSIFFIYM